MTKSKGIRPFVVRGSIEERFWAKVDKGLDDECWNWLGSTRSDGYGQINRGKTGMGMQSVHRLSWEIHNGKIPDNLHVLHRCDNKKCVNPAHLFLGTNNDNIKDRVQKGRSPRGEIHHNSKLTEEDIAVIRNLYIPYNKNSSLHALARRFQVDATTIHAIVHGETWSWMEK